MSLKVELKPGERMIIGNCLITNADQRTRLYIDGRTPILREKDILSPATADSPAKRIYLAVQLMYLEDDIERLRQRLFRRWSTIWSPQRRRQPSLSIKSTTRF